MSHLGVRPRVIATLKGTLPVDSSCFTLSSKHQVAPNTSGTEPFLLVLPLSLSCLAVPAPPHQPANCCSTSPPDSSLSLKGPEELSGFLYPLVPKTAALLGLPEYNSFRSACDFWPSAHSQCLGSIVLTTQRAVLSALEGSLPCFLLVDQI